ncbi:MAG: hypothetical protein HFF64_10975 [Oscillospiraceae bacterium]|nr:hypothetical protein [Oscillospiraceae bacterium]
MSEKNKWEELFDLFLNTIEFRLVQYPSGWGLVDRQGANLGDIEHDRSENAAGIIDRLDIYTSDYFASDIEECLGKGEFGSWVELLEEARASMTPEDLKQYSFDLDILDMICNHPEDIDLMKCCFTVSSDDICEEED